MGLHANSGRIEELGPPRWSFDHRACPTRPWHSTESGARDDVADFCAGALAGTRGRRLFTTEVWTVRGLVTYYTAFVIELQRVQVLGSTPYPDEAFVIQCLRPVTGEPDALLREGRILVCDRDPKWSRAVEQLLSTTGVRVTRRVSRRTLNFRVPESQDGTERGMALVRGHDSRRRRRSVTLIDDQRGP